jgi:hypothetical protein
MAGRFFAHPAADGLTRLARTEGGARAARQSYGPLRSLFGTWFGDQGWNLIAIPVKPPDGFKLIVQPYYETITITPIIAPVLNHGGPTTESIMGAEYSLQINDKQNDELLHVENGMWLLLTEGDPDAYIGDQPTIARQATVPHGDSVLAVGTWSQTNGAPDIPSVSSLPQNTEGLKVDGYTDPYIGPPIFPGFPTETPFQVLADVLKEQTVVETVSLTVGTLPLGGITNIPFIREHVDATQFAGSYWVETVRNADGSTFAQLQYAQSTILEFFQFNPSGKVRWPHMNLNTLVKL